MDQRVLRSNLCLASGWPSGSYSLLSSAGRCSLFLSTTNFGQSRRKYIFPRIHCSFTQARPLRPVILCSQTFGCNTSWKVHAAQNITLDERNPSQELYSNEEDYYGYEVEEGESSWFTPIKGAIGKAKQKLSSVLSLNEWAVRDYWALVAAVNQWEPFLEKLSDSELAEKTQEFRHRLAAGETLDDIQIEAFALVREASKRTLGLRPFDVQIMGAAVLHSGSIAEMKTGEGKTLVSALPAYLNALSGKGVHVVTVNDYLARRDADNMGSIHVFLGLTVGLIQEDSSPEERRAAYLCDITYSSNNQIAFDYLREHLVRDPDNLIMRWPEPFSFAIVDEVDSVLIDDGRNPLLISRESEGFAPRAAIAQMIAHEMVAMAAQASPEAAAAGENDDEDKLIVIDEKMKDVELTERGIFFAEASTGEDLWHPQHQWHRLVITALKANLFFFLNDHYLIRPDDDGVPRILIIDESTGRVAVGRKWSDGLHQAIEAKHNLPQTALAETVAQVTYQAFFRLYPKLSGMTGTAKTEEGELLRIFQTPVVQVPTNRPGQRKDFDTLVFKDTQSKIHEVVEYIKSIHGKGQPLLIGTASVEESEYLSALLREETAWERDRWRSHIQESRPQASPEEVDSLVDLNFKGYCHSVLNAKAEYVAMEAETISQAGRLGAITISTNMAGRGTDIILGGNPQMLARNLMKWNLKELVLGLVAPMAENPCKVPGLLEIQLQAKTLAAMEKARRTWRVVYGSEAGVQEAEDALQRARSRATRMPLQELLAVLQGQGAGAEVAELESVLAAAHRLVQDDCTRHCQMEGEQVKELGGLHVVGTSLNESRRIDNQLRGRAGRQGDPGCTRFIVSLEDRLFKDTGMDFVKSLFDLAKFPPGIPLHGGFLSSQLDQVQMTREQMDFAYRKQLMEFDDVLEVQRTRIYTLRKQVLREAPGALHRRVLRYIQGVVDVIVLTSVDFSKPLARWDLAQVFSRVRQLAAQTEIRELLDRPEKRQLAEEMNPAILDLLTLGPLDSIGEEDLRDELAEHINAYKEASRWHGAELLVLPTRGSPPGVVPQAASIQRWTEIVDSIDLRRGADVAGEAVLRKRIGDCLIAFIESRMDGLDSTERHLLERETVLKVLDQEWPSHLRNMANLRLAVSVRSFGRLNAIEEFKIESARYFLVALDHFQRELVQDLARRLPGESVQ